MSASGPNDHHTPRPLQEVQVLRDDRTINEDGSFQYAIETDNGINTIAEGAPGANGALTIRAQYA